MTTRTYIRPRKLDKRVRLDTRSTTKGASGGKRETWSALATVWASINNKAGREQRLTGAGGGVAAEADVEIEIRYRAGLTAENTRVVSGSTIYNVKHIDDVMEQHEYMRLSCSTGLNNG